MYSEIMATDSCGYDMEDISQHYAKYRPTCPPELYEKIFSYIDEGSEANGRRGLAVDIGCGCGHSTLALAKHFETVIGIDNSETQLKEAKAASAEFGNVFYKLGSAESVSSLVTKDSVDLITVGTALHWFDIDTFYEECLKILKPGGTLAVYAYSIPVYDNPAAKSLLQGVRLLFLLLRKRVYLFCSAMSVFIITTKIVTKKDQNIIILLAQFYLDIQTVAVLGFCIWERYFCLGG